MAIGTPIPLQAAATGHVIPVAGARLACWDTGGTGPAVVLCHPASQSNAIWLYQQPVLAAAGYRVVAYARRGHGTSERGSESERGTLAGDLAGVLDGLGIGRAHVLGAAAGGISAMAFAVAQPQRVASLVLAGTIVSPDEDEWRQLYARLGIAGLRGSVPTEFLELGPSYRSLDPEGTALFRELEHASKPGGTVSQPAGAHVTFAAMRQLELPVLLLTGEADLYAPPPLMRLIGRHLARHALITMREIGHAPYWEAPAEFNRIVLEFLARHRI